MIHACVQRFDVTDTVGNFLRTKQGLTPICGSNILLVENSKEESGESEPIVYLQLGTQDDRHDNNTNDLHDITSIW